MTHDRPISAFDAMDLQINETMKVRDLKTRAECIQAIVDIDMQIAGMLSQISAVEANPEHSLNKPGWRSKVQGAIRWKKRAKQAVNGLIGHFDKQRPASKDSLQHVLLDTFRIELGDDEFNRIRDIARDRYHVAFGAESAMADSVIPDDVMDAANAAREVWLTLPIDRSTVSEAIAIGIDAERDRCKAIAHREAKRHGKSDAATACLDVALAILNGERADG